MTAHRERRWNKRAALSTPRITRMKLDLWLLDYWVEATLGTHPNSKEIAAATFATRLRDFGIAVDPPTEAERAARMEVLGITDQDIADTMPPKQEDGYGR